MKKIDIRPGKENLFYDELGKRAIFVKFYMDGCPHCENMKSDWEELENELLNNYDGNFTIMSVNARALKSLNHPILNDVQGFPTIYMINERGQKIANYDGERTKNEMLKFILQNSNIQKKQSSLNSFKRHLDKENNSFDSYSFETNNEYVERNERKKYKPVSYMRRSGKYKLKRRRTKRRKQSNKSKMQRRRSRVSRRNIK